ncbi:hypothetical protein [Paenibacillus terrigena]|uniref:hypothetical protein n=1 Tax=Paenibacillus terrigena TaxID=369333 RepID=UPI000361E76B|nr:hypothetical protein [Paenibacillus terrigena]
MISRMMRMRAQSKYSAASVLSLLGVIVLHTVHWLSAPMLMSTMATMHHHDMAAGSSTFMNVFMILVIVLNVVGILFAVRQLIYAVKHRMEGLHTVLCSISSVLVIGLSVYFTLML